MGEECANLDAIQATEVILMPTLLGAKQETSEEKIKNVVENDSQLWSLTF